VTNDGRRSASYVQRSYFIPTFVVSIISCFSNQADIRVLVFFVEAWRYESWIVTRRREKKWRKISRLVERRWHRHPDWVCFSSLLCPHVPSCTVVFQSNFTPLSPHLLGAACMHTCRTYLGCLTLTAIRGQDWKIIPASRMNDEGWTELVQDLTMRDFSRIIIFIFWWNLYIVKYGAASNTYFVGMRGVWR